MHPPQRAPLPCHCCKCSRAPRSFTAVALDTHRLRNGDHGSSTPPPSIENIKFVACSPHLWQDAGPSVDACGNHGELAVDPITFPGRTRAQKVNEQAALLRNNLGPVDFSSLEAGILTLGIATPSAGAAKLYVHLGGKRLDVKVVLTEVLETRVTGHGTQVRVWDALYTCGKYCLHVR